MREFWLLARLVLWVVVPSLDDLSRSIDDETISELLLLPRPLPIWASLCRLVLPRTSGSVCCVVPLLPLPTWLLSFLLWG